MKTRKNRSGVMQALEMETASDETMSFVKSGRNKKSMPHSSKSSDDLVTMACNQKGKIMTVICCVLVVYILVSTINKGGAEPGSGNKGTLSSADKKGNGIIIDDAELSTHLPLSVNDKWGHWQLEDNGKDLRPSNDYPATYPNRDIPFQNFPDHAWQSDTVYVKQYLQQADQLIDRAMEAIFAEYGHVQPLNAYQLEDRQKMFQWTREELTSATGPPPKYTRHGDRGNGGWTTTRSADGLVRRLLHAMMTGDTFTVVMSGGHTAAAGQGNHFRQSYMMQFHKVMYPIFARLGVTLVTRNFGQGGLGNMQGSMGSGSIYGDEIDLLLWDSGMW